MIKERLFSRLHGSSPRILKVLAPLALMTSASILITSCSSSYSSDNAKPAAPQEMSVSSSMSMAAQSYVNEAETSEIALDVAEDTGGSSGVVREKEDTTPVASRKIIYRSSLELETETFEETLSRLKALVEQSGGYIENQNAQGRSIQYENDAGSRSASITARIPVETLGEITDSVGELCNVRSHSESAQDISDTYFDSEAHLRSLSLQEERLLAILEKAEKLEEVITLEQALSQTRYEIESLTASLRRMDSQVSYSYLSMELFEVRAYSPSASKPYTFGEKLSNAFQRSGDNLSHSLQGILFTLIANGPVVLLYLILWGLILFLVIRIYRLLKGRFGSGKSPCSQKKKPDSISPADPISPPSEEER